MNTALYRSASGSNTATITVHNHPLPYTAYLAQLGTTGMLSFISVLGAMVGFSFVSAFFAFSVVNDVETGVKRQQVRFHRYYVVDIKSSSYVVEVEV